LPRCMLTAVVLSFLFTVGLTCLSVRVRGFYEHLFFLNKRRCSSGVANCCTELKEMQNENERKRILACIGLASWTDAAVWC